MKSKKNKIAETLNLNISDWEAALIAVAWLEKKPLGPSFSHDLIEKSSSALKELDLLPKPWVKMLCESCYSEA